MQRHLSDDDSDILDEDVQNAPASRVSTNMYESFSLKKKKKKKKSKSKKVEPEDKENEEELPHSSCDATPLEPDQADSSSNQPIYLEEEPVAEEDTEEITALNKSKNKGKKGKGKSKARDIETLDDDKFDALLQKYTQKGTKGAPSVKSKETPADLVSSPAGRFLQKLACIPQNLNPMNEMARKFGRAAMKSLQPTARGRGNGRDRKGIQLTRSSLFIPSDETREWPAFSAHGLQFKAITSDDPRYNSLKASSFSPVHQPYQFAYTEEYWEAMYAFRAAIRTGNHHAIFPVLQRFPYFGPALIQISEAFRQLGQHQQHVEHVQRALYGYEIIATTVGFSWCNPLNHALGSHRTLPFEINENRMLFSALDSYIKTLEKKGCFLTAFEISKVLYSLDKTDPMNSLLRIDHQAIRGMQLDVFEQFAENLAQLDKHLSQLPNMMYSRALGLFLSESGTSSVAGLSSSSSSSSSTTCITVSDCSQGGKYSKSSAALISSIDLYPQLAVAILEKSEMKMVEVLTHSFFVETNSTHEAFRMLYDYYVEKMMFVWKVPIVKEWMAVNIRQSLRATSAEREFDSIRRSQLARSGSLATYFCKTAADLAETNDAIPQEEQPENPAGADAVAAAEEPVLRELAPHEYANLGNRHPFALFLQSLLPWNTLSSLAHERPAADDDFDEELHADDD